MTIEGIIAIILGAIGTVGAFINSLWGPAWLAKKEKVIIREPHINISLVYKPESPQASGISMGAYFTLVHIRGEKALYFESAYSQLNRAVCQQLDQYFCMPSKSRIQKWSEQMQLEPWDRKLEKGEPVRLGVEDGIKMRESFIELEEKLRADIEEKVKRLEEKYEIVWTSGEGKEYHYRFPNKWWSNLVPEKLWWRI